MLRPSETRPTQSNVLILGGPGQGKSTLSQLLSQSYRLVFLEDHPVYKMDPAERSIQGALDHHIFSVLGVPRPSNRRWPFTIKLSEFGDAVAADGKVGVLKFMASKMTEMSSDDNPVTPALLKKWLAEWPWVLIFDGLDEIPSRAARELVFDRIDDFMTDARSLDADLFVVATTRPQGYAGEMSTETYHQFNLAPLAADQALEYVERLSRAQYQEDDDLRLRINRQAREALARDATSRLMTTPLQVTIMTILLARRISLPESKHELFNSYFSTIYEREMNKGNSSLARLLREQRRNVEFVHERSGMALQQRAESVGHADALLKVIEFEAIIEHRLKHDEDFSEALTEKIKSDLSAAALDRLVLLVPRVAGYVGYELRSLQEFMAASFFFSKGEQHSLDPFEATAHSTHWRHTWLLAAGRLFEEHQSLRDSLLSLVDDIGLKSKVSRACLIGPLLALDILDADIAANAPRYHRKLVSIVLDLLTITVGSHTQQLNRVLKDVAEKDDESWLLVTERLNEGLLKEGPGRVAVLFLLATWCKAAGKTGSYARDKLGRELGRLDQLTAGSLVYCSRNNPERAQLQHWSYKPLTPSSVTDLAEVVRPYISKVERRDSAAETALLLGLQAIEVLEFSYGRVTVRAVGAANQAAQESMIERLIEDDSLRLFLASVLAHFQVADANPSDFLRTLLRRSLERVRPSWRDPWREELAQVEAMNVRGGRG